MVSSGLCVRRVSNVQTCTQWRIETLQQHNTKWHELNWKHKIKTIVSALVYWTVEPSSRFVYIDVIFLCVSYALHYVPLDNLGFLMGYEPIDMWRSFVTICLRLFGFCLLFDWYFCVSVTRFEVIENYCLSIRHSNTLYNGIQ